MALIDSCWCHIRKSTPFKYYRSVSNIFLRYGSVVTTHLLRTPELASQISSIVLVDPVSLLLHQPDVAYNFVRFTGCEIRRKNQS